MAFGSVIYSQVGIELYMCMYNKNDYAVKEKYSSDAENIIFVETTVRDQHFTCGYIGEIFENLLKSNRIMIIYINMQASPSSAYCLFKLRPPKVRRDHNLGSKIHMGIYREKSSSEQSYQYQSITR